MSWPVAILVILVLAGAGYLLVRHRVIDWRDALAGGGIISGLALIWVLVFGRRPEPADEDAPTKPAPPTHDVDDIIDEADRRSAEEPGDDIHEKLHDRLRREIDR